MNTDHLHWGLVGFVMCVLFSILLLNPLRVYNYKKSVLYGKSLRKDACLKLCQEEKKEEWKRERTLERTGPGIHHLHDTSSKNLSKEAPSRTCLFPCGSI